MERHRTPGLCCLAALLLLTALATDGFTFTRLPDTPLWLFAARLFGVRLLCALLAGAGLMLCRARTGRQAAAVLALCLGVTVGLSMLGLPALRAGGMSADLSRYLPGFVLMLLGADWICRAGLRRTLADLFALGLCALLLLAPGVLFGWGVSPCFFDTLCLTAALFALPGVDALLELLSGTRRTPRRDRL